MIDLSSLWLLNSPLLHEIKFQDLLSEVYFIAACVASEYSSFKVELQFPKHGLTNSVVLYLNQ